MASHIRECYSGFRSLRWSTSQFRWSVSPDYALARFKDLTLEIKSHSFIQLTGSLHKSFAGGYNYSDFHFPNLLETVETLCEKLNINPFGAILRNLEIGVNIIPPLKTKRLTGLIMECKGKSFSPMQGRNPTQLGVHCISQRFETKIYDKKNQWPQLGIEKETMRFEIKVTRMAHLKEHDVSTLADLLNPKKLLSLGKSISKHFGNLLFLDKSLQIRHPKKGDTEILDRWSNPLLVRELRETNRKGYERERRKIRSLQKEFSTERIQERTQQIIESKWKELSNLDSKTYTKLTDFLNHFPEFDLNQFNRSNSMLIPSTLDQENRYCKITGKDISDQRPGSKFLSAKKIGYIQAHKLRNKDSNPRNSLRRRIERIKQTSMLFPTAEMVKLSNEQKKDLEFWKGTSLEVNI